MLFLMRNQQGQSTDGILPMKIHPQPLSSSASKRTDKQMANRTVQLPKVAEVMEMTGLENNSGQ